MKRFFIYLLLPLMFIGLSLHSSAQGGDNLGLLALTSYVDSSVAKDLGGSASILENRLSQIISANGMTNGYSRFILTAFPVVVTKDVLGTAPSTFAYTINLSLFLGDGFDGNVFTSHTLTLKGVGRTEEKAFINAFNNLSTNSREIKDFVSRGKEEIVKYYSQRCDVIIRKAQMLENQNHFDEAIYMLINVPEASSCYNKALTAVDDIYKKKINRECPLLLNDAKNYWAANPTVEGAQVVAEILRDIDPRANCYKDVSKFTATVGKRVLELDGREWDLYVDKEVGLQKDLIKAYRDVGKAWGEGQPKTVHYNIRGWW